MTIDSLLREKNPSLILSSISSVVVGAAMCVAMSQATDLMLDLKTGYLVGAIPKRQQMGQFLGTWIGPILMIALSAALRTVVFAAAAMLPSLVLGLVLGESVVLCGLGGIVGTALGVGVVELVKQSPVPVRGDLRVHLGLGGELLAEALERVVVEGVAAEEAKVGE